MPGYLQEYIHMQHTVKELFCHLLVLGRSQRPARSRVFACRLAGLRLMLSTFPMLSPPRSCSSYFSLNLSYSTSVATSSRLLPSVSSVVCQTILSTDMNLMLSNSPLFTCELCSGRNLSAKVIPPRPSPEDDCLASIFEIDLRRNSCNSVNSFTILALGAISSNGYADKPRPYSFQLSPSSRQNHT